MLADRKNLDPQVTQLLRRLKLGPLTEVLPERLLQARQKGMDPEDFLLILLGDEAERRQQNASTHRAAKAGLAADMVLDAWDRHTEVSYDRDLLDRLMTLTFLERHEHVCAMGPVGVGKTMIAQGLGHIASARGKSVANYSAVKLFAQLKVGRVYQTYAKQMRQLTTVDLLILDDFALHPMDMMATVDFAEIVVERHRHASIILTSNRDPSEWIPMMAEQLLAQSAVDRFTNNAHDLVLDGPTYRPKQKPGRSAQR